MHVVPVVCGFVQVKVVHGSEPSPCIAPMDRIDKSPPRYADMEFMDASPTRSRYTFWELHRMLADCYETDVATSSVAPGRISWTERSSSIHRGRKGRSQSVKRDRRPSLEVTVVHPPKPPPTQELPPAPPLDPILCQSVSPDSSSEKPANVAHRSFVQTLRSSAWFADVCFVVFFSSVNALCNAVLWNPERL